jgi:drug/metabolite transporter (DMT)-like permease
MGSTRKGMLNVLIAAVLWGSSGRLRAVHHGEKPHFFALPDHGSPAVYRRDPVDALLRSRRQDFPVIKHRKDALSLLIFSLVGALTVQLTFLLTIEKSNAATATVLQFLSPTIIVAWFALARKKRPGVFVCRRS